MKSGQWTIARHIPSYSNCREIKPIAYDSNIFKMAGNIRTTQMMNIVLVVALLAGTSSTLAFSSFATYKVNARDKSLGIPTSTNTKSRQSYCQSIQLSPGQRQAHYHGTNTGTRLLQSTNPYGRGAEIWPPSSEQPIRLENSFPNGVLPDNVVEALSRLTAPEQAPPTAPSLVDTGKPLRRQNVPRAIGRILRRAAYAQEETEADAASSVSSSSSSISSVFSRAGRNTAALVDKTPMVLAASLVVFGMIRPLDALVVSFLTGYFVILFLWARSLRRDNVTPIMPSLPPQGHVPNLISNPLGPCLTTFSVTYDYWLRTGVLLGLLAPIVVMLRYAFVSHQMDCAQACARPIFFMCCQAMSESVARRSLVRKFFCKGINVVYEQGVRLPLLKANNYQ